VIGVQMGAEHDVDVLGRRAGLAQAREKRRVALMEARQPGRSLWLPPQQSSRMVCRSVRMSHEWTLVISRSCSGE
jgi:hypothetical protein